MQPRLPLSAPPFRLLLRLEWLLLGLVALMQIPLGAAQNGHGRELVLNELGVVIFALLGLVVPERRGSKILYTLAEFVLILLLTFRGGLTLFALLYVVLVIRNCLILPEPGRSLVTGVAFVCCIGSQTHRLLTQRMLIPIPLERPAAVFIGFLIVVGLVMLFLQLLVDALLLERQGQEQLAQANQQLRQYALRIESLAAVQERNRIAREIHDSLGHSLTAFNLHLEAALRLLHVDLAEAEVLLQEAKQLGSKSLQDVRQSVGFLRADPLQSQPLDVAMQQLCQEFQRSTRVVPRLQLNLPDNLLPEVKVTAYRLVQEALTNISKHAITETLAITVTISVQAEATGLGVRVKDTGLGFDPSQTTTGFGLQGMRERILSLGGKLEIITAPGRGCEILAHLPYSGSG